jgi:streptogramin lyase
MIRRSSVPILLVALLSLCPCKGVPIKMRSTAFTVVAAASLASCITASTIGPTLPRGHQRRANNAGIQEAAPLPLLSGGCETEFHPDQPDIAWVELILGNAIQRVNLTSGEQKRFPLKNPVGLPSGMEFLADGNLWFSEVAGNSMVKLDPSDGSMTEYPFPWTGINLLDNLPVGIRVTIDVGGNRDRGAWFTAVALNAIGRLDLDTYEYSLYPLPNPLSAPLIIRPGPGSTMAFSELTGNRIGTIDVNTKEIKEYTIPTPLSLVQGVAIDESKDDGIIWWSGTGSGTFGTIDTKTGKVTEISIAWLRLTGKSTVVGGPSLGSSALVPLPGPMRVGSDGKIYFVMGSIVTVAPGNRIGQYDPKTGLLVEYETPSSLFGPCDINAQHPGTMYFSGYLGDAIGKLDYL